jgi:hypothetical protein
VPVVVSGFFGDIFTKVDDVFTKVDDVFADNYKSIFRTYLYQHSMHSIQPKTFCDINVTYRLGSSPSLKGLKIAFARERSKKARKYERNVRRDGLCHLLLYI